MGRTNGRSEIEAERLDVEHELPASEDTSEPAAESVAAKAPQPVSEADGELQKLRAERDALLDRLARLQAEFENARKRAAREQLDFRDYALADALKTLLSPLDSFERALQSDARDGSEFRSGVELIYKQLQDSLAKLGVRPVPAKGETFDPRVHEAIEMVDTDQARDHEVIEE
ncbi:MAG TPA: nucleotide exchange factor GrpE, partial [Terriglobales bacterium]